MIEEAAQANPIVIEERDYCAVADKYIADILSGAIPACKNVIAACKRHVRDLERVGTEGFPYVFDRDRGNAFCASIERFPHIKGKWASKRENIHLEPWQCFFVTTGFGWLRAGTVLRRFGEMYLEVPRKNAKSTLAAAIGNVMLLDDNEYAAEVYAGATTEKQAWEVFGPARQMLIKSPAIQVQYGLDVMSRSIVKNDDASKFWPLIGNPGDGASPSCAIIDEFHEHDNSNLVDTMVTGMGAREQPVVLIITTSGTNLGSPCYDKHKEVEKVLRGTFVNERLFGVIYSIDLPEGEEPGDDWADPAALRKANPNIGVSVDEDYLLAQQRNAVANPSYQNRFKTKHLDVWCNASVAGINMYSWQQAADKSLKLEQFHGEQAIFVLDLASKTDICSFVQLFQKVIDGDRHYYAFARNYLPEEAIEEAKANQQAYRRWVVQSHLFATPGAEIDFDQLRDDVVELSTQFQVLEVAYDPWRATQLSHQLAKAGAVVVEVGQTAKNMGIAFDEFLAALKAGRFHHNGDPVLEWMASNVIAKTAAKGVVIPAKEKVEAKIDGIVAIVMGISRALAHEPQYGLDEFFKNAVSVG